MNRKLAVAYEVKHNLRAKILISVLVCIGASAIAQNHSDAYMQSILAIQQQIERGDFYGAHKSIESAATQYPADGGLDNLLGVVEAQQGHAASARQAFLSATRHNPQLTAAFLNLSRIDMQSARENAAIRAEALQMSEMVVQRDSANDEAHYQIATIFAWEKKYLQSLTELKKMSLQAQGSVTAQSIVCEADISLKHDKAAESAVHELAANPDLNEQDANACLSALRAAHRAPLIAELLTASAKTHALSASSLRMLGLAQEADQKFDQARITLEKAYAADPNSADVLVDLTRVAKAAGDNQGALGYLAHARELRPEDATLPYEFGVICVQMGLYAESRKAIGDALKIDPQNPDYNLSMGLVVSYSEDPSQAMPYLQKFHTLRPEDPNGALALGSTFYRTKDYDTAIQWLKQAIQDPSTAAEAHYYLGRIEHQQDNVEAAIHDLKESLQLHPNQSSVLAELGQISISQHNYPDAKTYLDKALKIDPDNYGANYGLLMLYAHNKDPRRQDQVKRFEEIKDKKDARDLEMTRSFEIRQDGKSNHPEGPEKSN